MINISELNSFPTQDGGSLALLKELAQKYCPEELQAERQRVVGDGLGIGRVVLPDESLNLSELEAGRGQWL